MKGLKLLLAVDRNLLTKLGEANAKDIDDAMVEVAKLALSLRSDEAPEHNIVDMEQYALRPAARVDELDDARR